LPACLIGANSPTAAPTCNPKYYLFLTIGVSGLVIALVIAPAWIINNISTSVASVNALSPLLP
jgi:hypothetical protein